MPWSHKVYDLLPQWRAGKLSIPFRIATGDNAP